MFPDHYCLRVVIKAPNLAGNILSEYSGYYVYYVYGGPDFAELKLWRITNHEFRIIGKLNSVTSHNQGGACAL